MSLKRPPEEIVRQHQEAERRQRGSYTSTLTGLPLAPEDSSSNSTASPSASGLVTPSSSALSTNEVSQLQQALLSNIIEQGLDNMNQLLPGAGRSPTIHGNGSLIDVTPAHPNISVNYINGGTVVQASFSRHLAIPDHVTSNLSAAAEAASTARPLAPVTPTATNADVDVSTPAPAEDTAAAAGNRGGTPPSFPSAVAAAGDGDAPQLQQRARSLLPRHHRSYARQETTMSPSQWARMEAHRVHALRIQKEKKALKARQEREALRRQVAERHDMEPPSAAPSSIVATREVVATTSAASTTAAGEGGTFTSSTNTDKGQSFEEGVDDIGVAAEASSSNEELVSSDEEEEDDADSFISENEQESMGHSASSYVPSQEHSGASSSDDDNDEEEEDAQQEYSEEDVAELLEDVRDNEQVTGCRAPRNGGMVARFEPDEESSLFEDDFPEEEHEAEALPTACARKQKQLTIQHCLPRYEVRPPRSVMVKTEPGAGAPQPDVIDLTGTSARGQSRSNGGGGPTELIDLTHLDTSSSSSSSDDNDDDDDSGTSSSDTSGPDSNSSDLDVKPKAKRGGN